ncbi:tetratricopeptide repeat protein [Asticcacaulis sp. 201]|uniref:tetratricopeptide repeat protein n=1 Tax=Asticcacaulis sp. 201 TaxID=3028787 RepID=UPI002916C74A|nr:tetratricopeptide repeat protein [Asticcacaulis sp. 201]MDV6330071.1 hypothetical protein [Asticcacaulis sp. 201]
MVGMNRLVACGLMIAGILAPVTAQARPWIKAESEHFVIYSAAPEAATRAYVAKLETFYDVTGEFYDQMSETIVPQSTKTRFTLMSSVYMFCTVRPEAEQRSFSPYLPCREGVQYFSTADGDDNNRLFGGALDPDIDLNLAYLFYGYNSQILHERFVKLPRWVASGLNWYFMTAVFKDDKILIGKSPPNIAMSLREDNVADLRQAQKLDFAEVIADAPVSKFRADVYALQSWTMVSYLMSDPDRRAKFFSYLRQVDEGADPMTAYKATIGIEPAQYDQVLKTYMRKGLQYSSYKVANLPTAAVTITALPDYPGDLPLVDAAIQTCQTPEHGLDLLKTARKSAERFPNDRLAQTVVARGEIRFGDPNAAKAFLVKALAADPKDYEAQYLLGRMYLQLAQTGPQADQAKNYAAARTELGKAYKLNPSSPEGIYFYIQAFRDRPNYPDYNTLRALEVANSYSGDRYDLYYADLLTRRGRYAEALTIVDDHLVEARAQGRRERADFLQSVHDFLAAKTPKGEFPADFDKFSALPED